MTPTTESLDRLGFPAPSHVGGLKSIAHLFGTSKRRCGIYLLVLPQDRLYIGQAVDVVRRFAQHAKAHERIEEFSFIPTPRTKLDARERELIFLAESSGLTLVNVVHISDVEGESDLDALVSPNELSAWLKDPFQQNENDFETQPLQFPPAQIARFAGNYARFKDHPIFVPAGILLYLYLDAAVPYPRRTEYSFWSVSCMPATNQATFPRALCVSASVMEMFCIGYYKDPKLAGAAWGFVNVASDALFNSYGDEGAFQQVHPHVTIRRSAYRDAGQHQINLGTQVQDDMFNLLNDAAVTKAAAELCARLMRKRATIYSKFHCPQLADAAFELRAMESQAFDKLLNNVFPVEDQGTSSEAGDQATPGQESPARA